MVLKIVVEEGDREKWVFGERFRDNNNCDALQYIYIFPYIYQIVLRLSSKTVHMSYNKNPAYGRH